MYVTICTLSNAKNYQVNQYNDCLFEGDAVVDSMHQEIYAMLKLACEAGNVLDPVLEIVNWENGKVFVHENFFSESLTQAQTFQQDFKLFTDLFENNNWTVTLETKEITDISSYELPFDADPTVVKHSWLSLVDPSIEYFMFNVYYPLN